MSFARNTAEWAWAGALIAQVGEDAVWIGIWDAQTNGNFLAGVQVSNNPDPLAIGEVYYIAASGLAIQQTAAANETEAMAADALRGRLGGVGPVARWYGVHDGDPGTTGANETTIPRISRAHSTLTYSDT